MYTFHMMCITVFVFVHLRDNRSVAQRTPIYSQTPIEYHNHYGIPQIGNSLYSFTALVVYPVLATSRSLLKRKVSENVLEFSPSLPHKNAGIRPRKVRRRFLSSSFLFIIYQSNLKFSKCM